MACEDQADSVLVPAVAQVAVSAVDPAWDSAAALAAILAAVQAPAAARVAIVIMTGTTIKSFFQQVVIARGCSAPRFT